MRSQTMEFQKFMSRLIRIYARDNLVKPSKKIYTIGNTFMSIIILSRHIVARSVMIIFNTSRVNVPQLMHVLNKLNLNSGVRQIFQKRCMIWWPWTSLRYLTLYWRIRRSTPCLIYLILFTRQFSQKFRQRPREITNSNTIFVPMAQKHIREKCSKGLPYVTTLMVIFKFVCVFILLAFSIATLWFCGMQEWWHGSRDGRVLCEFFNLKG